MAVIALQGGVVGNNGPVVLTTATLTTSDTLPYTQGSAQKLIIRNPTGGAVTLTLTGSAPLTAIDIPGYGGSVSAAGGKAVVVAIGSFVYVDLDDISAYLAGNGTVTLTSTVAGLVVAHYN